MGVAFVMYCWLQLKTLQCHKNKEAVIQNQYNEQALCIHTTAHQVFPSGDRILSTEE